MSSPQNPARSLRLALTLLCLGSLLCACKVTRPGRSLPLVMSQDLEIAADEPIDVEIENRAGSVDVRAFPKLETVSVRAWNTFAQNRQDTPGWVSASLDRSAAGTLVLRVLSAPQEINASAVGIRVGVPTLGSVHIVNSAGQVIVRDWNGALDVQNNVSTETGGSVDARTFHDISQSISVLTRRGDANLCVGEHSTGLVEVRGDRGHNVDVERVQVGNIRDGVRWQGVIGNAQSKIIVRAEEGAASLTVGKQDIREPSTLKADVLATLVPVKKDVVPQRGRFRPPVPEIKMPRTVRLPASGRAVAPTPPVEPAEVTVIPEAPVAVEKAALPPMDPFQDPTQEPIPAPAPQR